MKRYTKIYLPTTLVRVLLSAFMYATGIIVLGTAIFPGVFLLYQIWAHTASVILGLRLLYFCFGFVFGYFLSGAMLMTIVSLIRIIFQMQLKEGEYSGDSFGIFKWLYINAFFLAVKVAFMDFILLTPYISLFFRLMGAKIGKNVEINSKNMMDLSLLEIGDNVIIGGNATVICHSFERGGIVLKKIKIGNNVIIGLNSVIFPGVEIGNNAVVAAGAIVPKDTRIPANTTYFGTPIK